MLRRGLRSYRRAARRTLPPSAAGTVARRRAPAMDRRERQHDRHLHDFERASDDLGEYEKWTVERMFVMPPAQAIAGRELQTFKDFLPRQKPGSFSIGDAMEKLIGGGSGSN